MKFLTAHFDRLLLFAVMILIYGGYLYTGNLSLEQILRDVVLAIFVVVGARRMPDATAQTNIAADSVEVNQPKNEAAKDNLSIT